MEVPKIQSPKTGQLINLYSDEINQLIIEGYKEEQLLLNRITPTIYNRQSIFVDEVLYNIMLNSDINEIVNICNTDRNAAKLCKNSEFWKNKIIIDKLPLFDIDSKQSLSSYVRRLNVVNKTENLMKNQDYGFTFSTKIDITFLLPKGIVSWINKRDINNYSFQQIQILKDPYIHRDRIYYSLSDLTYDSWNIEKEQIKNILIQIFWYFPDIAPIIQ
jgi:hypothetical protein